MFKLTFQKKQINNDYFDHSNENIFNQKNWDGFSKFIDALVVIL